MTALLSVVVLLTQAFTRPETARCPDGWWLNMGVRSTGDFSCHTLVHEIPGQSVRGGYEDHSIDVPGDIVGHVYCDGYAFTDDGVRVLCRKRSAS